MYLNSKEIMNLTAREKYLRGLIDSQSIEYFPINKALSLEEGSDEVDVAEKVR